MIILQYIEILRIGIKTNTCYCILFHKHQKLEKADLSLQLKLLILASFHNYQYEAQNVIWSYWVLTEVWFLWTKKIKTYERFGSGINFTHWIKHLRYLQILNYSLSYLTIQKDINYWIPTTRTKNNIISFLYLFFDYVLYK